LSLAAHLRARGIDFRVFGKPMDSWANHMVEGMKLKSDGWVSNLSTPAPGYTLKTYCSARGLAYCDQALPVPLETFLAYAHWFRASQVPDLEERMVTRIAPAATGFSLALDDGETFTARQVVLAVGITWYAQTPSVLSTLTPDVLSHSFDHRDIARFAGEEIAIVGAGSSAIDLAHALNESGARPHIIARADKLAFNSVPDGSEQSLLSWIQSPASGIGSGWRSYFCAHAPLLFHRLPRHLKDRAIASHMHPAGGFFMRDRIEGVVPAHLGRSIADARMMLSGRAVLDLVDASGTHESLAFDRVIAATGYKPDLLKLPFLDERLARRAAPLGGAPEVSDVFETKVPGLYAVGLNAMQSFGPLMRFMVGAEFAAPHLASHLNRMIANTGARRVA
jgi:thioredoxin reductase